MKLDRKGRWSFDEIPFTHGLMVMSGGEVVWEQGECEQVFNLASVTKILTSRAVLVAVERGMLSLDTPAGPPGATVRHLLAHASGLDMETPTIAAPVGTKRIYSNVGYDVLGEVIESATGTPSSRWIEESVLEPLSMACTDVPGSPAKAGRSNVRDLLILGAELLHPTLISEELARESTAPVFPGLGGILPGYGMQKPNLWGLGVEIRGAKKPHWTAPSASPWVCGHFGVSGAFIWVDQSIDACAVFLGSEPFGAWHRKNWSRINESILTNLR